MKKLHFDKKYFNSIIIFSVLFVLLFTTFKFGGVQSKNEISEIKATSDTKFQVKLYRDLIDRVGPEKAQEDLYMSGLPFTGTTHLLNHTVGDYLYEKFGPKGLLQCKDYFLSSCYHGFVLNAISDGGLSQVVKTFDECRKGGHTIYVQCAHGMGHGFLAHVGYKNLIKALKTCDEANSMMQGFPVYNCYDGVFMENIWAVHDGEPSPDRWVKESDPLYPCNDPNIESKYILACWSNQATLAYQLFKGDIKKTANLCNGVKKTEYKEMCFDNLSRQIHPVANGSSAKTLELCGLLPNSRWVNLCVAVNAGAGYSVGDRSLPFEICGDVSETGKRECYSRLFSIMGAYRKPNENLEKMCSQISDDNFRKECETVF